jgi:hypothetical protein
MKHINVSIGISFTISLQLMTVTDPNCLLPLPIQEFFKLYWYSRAEGGISLPFALCFPFKACLAFSPGYNLGLQSSRLLC